MGPSSTEVGCDDWIISADSAFATVKLGNLEIPEPSAGLSYSSREAVLCFLLVCMMTMIVRVLPQQRSKFGPVLVNLLDLLLF